MLKWGAPKLDSGGKQDKNRVLMFWGGVGSLSCDGRCPQVFQFVKLVISPTSYVVSAAYSTGCCNQYHLGEVVMEMLYVSAEMLFMVRVLKSGIMMH